MRELTVGKNDAGQRLDRFVSKAVPGLPDSLLQKYIRLKRVKIGGRAAKRDVRLVEGDVVSLYIGDEFFEKSSKSESVERDFSAIIRPSLEIVYEDDGLLLVNKLPGVVSHGGSKPSESLVANIQVYIYNKGEWDPRNENSFAPALCNRLDRNTGGVVIAAKNAETLRVIGEKLRSGEVGRYYLCAVGGVVNPPSGILEGHLAKDERENRVRARSEAFEGSKYAATEYRTVASRDGLTLLECRLITGRTHQIRAQLADAGHPILGDTKYGGEKRGERYQALWSYKLTFDFKTDAGNLNHLAGKRFEVEKIGFVQKYFGDIGG